MDLIDRGAFCCCPWYYPGVPNAYYSSARYTQRFPGFWDSSVDEIYLRVDASVTDELQRVINRDNPTGAVGEYRHYWYSGDPPFGEPDPYTGHILDNNQLNSPTLDYSLEYSWYSENNQTIHWFNNDTIPDIAENTIVDGLTNSSATVSGDINFEYTYTDEDSPPDKTGNFSVTPTADIEVKADDWKDTSIAEYGVVSGTMFWTAFWTIEGEELVTNGRTIEITTWGGADGEATPNVARSYSSIIDNAYIEANYSLVTPVANDYTGLLFKSEITYDTTVSSTTQDRTTPGGGTGTYTYRYKDLTAVFVRVRCLIPFQHKGSYYAIEYEIYDDNESDPLLSIHSTGTIIWTGPGDVNDPNSDTWYTDWLDLPEPELGKVWRFRITRYRGVSTHPWRNY